MLYNLLLNGSYCRMDVFGVIYRTLKNALKFRIHIGTTETNLKFFHFEVKQKEYNNLKLSRN